VISFFRTGTSGFGWWGHVQRRHVFSGGKALRRKGRPAWRIPLHRPAV